MVGTGRLDGRTAHTAIKNRRRERRPQRPKQIGRAEQIRQRRPPVSARCRQRERGEIRRARHADLRIGRRHAAFCSSDIRTALQQVRRQGLGHVGRCGQRGGGLQRKGGRRLPQQRGQRMLQLAARGLRLQQLHLGGLVLRLGLSHIGAGGHTRRLAVARQLPAAVVGLERLAQQRRLGLGRAQ